MNTTLFITTEPSHTDLTGGCHTEHEVTSDPRQRCDIEVRFPVNHKHTCRSSLCAHSDEQTIIHLFTSRLLTHMITIELRE